MSIAKEDLRRKIAQLIKDKTGIVIYAERSIDLEIVLDSRLLFHNVSPEQYYSYILTSYDEIVYLASCFTIQETSFYRYKSHYDRMKLEVFPALIANRSREKTIRILSAGCATGEEPYTIAMILHDLIGDLSLWNIEITATDIHDNALAMAREGVYTKYKLRNIDSSYIARYFVELKEDPAKKAAKSFNSAYKLSDSIKRMVTFKHCNLIREPFELANLRDIDIILCENVIIYFCLESIQRLIDNFHSILAPGGYLFLGYSETLNVIRHRFALSWWKESYAYVKQPGVAETEGAPVNGSQPECHEYEPGIPVPETGLSYESLLQLAILSYHNNVLDRVYAILKMIETDSFTLNEVFYVLKAEYCFDQKDNINAANECRKAINRNPFYIDAHLLLGAIYLDLGMLESAIFEIKTALYIDKDNVLANLYCSLYNKRIESDSEYVMYLDRSRKLFQATGILTKGIFPSNGETEKRVRSMVLGTYLD
jgi:chemotaxis protein methyltransferase CheR